jgi:hypothetical protein
MLTRRMLVKDKYFWFSIAGIAGGVAHFCPNLLVLTFPIQVVGVVAYFVLLFSGR